MHRSYSLLVIVLLCASTFSRAEDARPILKTLDQPELVSYPEFGFAMVIPAGSKLIGKRATKEPGNYVFPWIRSQYWGIDFAFEPFQSKGTLSDRVLKMVNDMARREKKIWRFGKMEGCEYGGIQFVQVPCMKSEDWYPAMRYEDNGGFKIVRYYFITPDDKLAFIHAHSTGSLDDFPAMLSKSIFRSKEAK